MLPADAQENLNVFRYNLGRLFDSYPRKMFTPESPFQRYVRDRDYSALTETQKRGLKLFIGKAACAECHADKRANGPDDQPNPSRVHSPRTVAAHPVPNPGRGPPRPVAFDRASRSGSRRRRGAP